MAVARWLRLFIQLVFFMLAPGVWAAAFSGIKNVVSQLGAAEAIAVDPTLILLIALLVFTILFGRFFCGYACAFGTLNDVVYQLGDAVLRRAGLPRLRLSLLLETLMRYFKYILLAGICAVAYLGAVDIINENSPWTAFSHLVSLQLDGFTAVGLVLLIALMVGMLWKERFFCEFLCPMGAVFAMMPTAPWALRWRAPERCPKTCTSCGDACPVGITQSDETVLGGECIACGRCEIVCPEGNVSSGLGGFARRVRGGRMPQAGAAQADDGRRFVMRHVVAVLAEAAVLLALLWALGVVRFLPAPPS